MTPLGARAVYVQLVGRGMSCPHLKIRVGTSFPGLIWLHPDGTRSKQLHRGSWSVGCQCVANGSKRKWVMGVCPRPLCQQFVGNTWQPLLRKAPIYFGSRRGVEDGRASHQVFLWPLTRLEAGEAQGWPCLRQKQGGGLGGGRREQLPHTGWACPLANVLLLHPFSWGMQPAVMPVPLCWKHSGLCVGEQPRSAW